VAEYQMNEAMEKLNRGIQESKLAAQQQTLELAQEYFDDSVAMLKQQIKDNRSTLRSLPEQVPGGQEEPFQTMFQELMGNYGKMEEALNEAKKNVADIDPEQIRRQGEVNATDAARRDATELGIDLTEIEGTGSDGRVTVDDVKNFSEATEDGAAGVEEEPDASEAARREAEELGVELSQLEGSGSGGRIIVSDVVEASKDAARREAEERGLDISQLEGEGSGPGGLVTVKDVMSMAGEAQEQADGGTEQATEEAPQGTAGDTAQQVQNAAGQAAGQAQETAQGAAQQVQEAAGQATDQAGQAVQGAQDTAGQITDQATGILGGVTDQVGQAAQGVQGTAEQAAGQAQQAAGQATQQAQDAAGQVTEQAAGEEEEPRVTNAARRKAEELGVDLSQVQGSGAGGLITIRDVTDLQGS
jgi:pyruvate/2-oxoglutarate dehydrogenase complex dihydrolipoamide acyltransferase (E2) component